MSGYPPIAELVPHSGPMLLLEELLSWQQGEAECALVVRAGAPFVVAGSVPSAATIEYMAQAVAACLGYEAMLGGGAVRVGMVIACKRFDAFGDALAVGDALRIRVRSLQGNDALSQFECEVWRADALFSSANLTVYYGAGLS